MTALAEPDTITDLDFDLEIPCQGRGHVGGIDAHVIDQQASYALMSPCCGLRLLLCRGRAMYLKTNAFVIHCRSCDRDSSAGKWRFREI